MSEQDEDATKEVLKHDMNNREGGSLLDRSGGKTDYWLQKQQQKEERAKKKEQKKAEEVLYAPITAQTFQRGMLQMYSAMEKLAQEIRANQLRLEATMRLMYDKNLMTPADTEKYVKGQIEWNRFIDSLATAEPPVPIAGLVSQINEWNNTHELKISWQHVDLAVRLLDEDGMTLEEKLMVAADMDMPEAFIQALREKERGTEDPATSAEVLASAINAKHAL